MQYQDIYIRVELNKFENCYYSEENIYFADFSPRKLFEDPESMGITDNHITPKLKSNLIVDYIYLEHEERKYFAGRRHEYLIEQVQRNPEVVVDHTNINEADDN